MKKRIFKKLLCLLLTFVLFTIPVLGIAAGAIDAENQGTLDTWDLDTHEDDPVNGKLDKDDFATPAEWEAYLQEHPEESVSVMANSAYPNKEVTQKATLRYTVKGLLKNTVVQKFYLGSKYIYAVQRVGVNAYLSRYLIDAESKTATYVDRMRLMNFGHTQTLEWYEHNGTAYFWVGCKANTAESYTDYNWSMQIGRIQYEGGKTIEDYKDICRLANLNYANSSVTSFGSVKRVDAALSSDRTKLFLWVQNTNNDIQLSYYDNDTLNDLLDEKESETSKYVSFKDNKTLKNACLGSFEQLKSVGNRIMPNGSCQGVEFTDANSIYIAGGNVGETPKFAKLVGSGDDYTYSCELTATNSSFDDDTELEGVQLKGDYVYFGIADTSIRRDEEQYIYSVPKSAF